MIPSSVLCMECENKPQAQHHQLQKLLDSSPDVICSFDAEGRFLTASAAAKTMWGFEPGELIGKQYMDFVLPEDHVKTILAAEAIISGVDLRNFENRYIRKDGSIVPIVWSATWDRQEEVMYCVGKDITEQKQLEDNLAVTRRMFESFMNNSPMVGWITDEHCNMRYMNDLYLKTYNRSEEDLGKSIYDLFPDQIALDYHMNNLRVIRDGKPVETVEKAVLPGGKEQILKIFKFPLQIDNKNMVAGWAVDITDQMELQQELEKSVEIYQCVNEATSDAIYDWNLVKNRIAHGVGFENLFGFQEKEISIKRQLSRIHPEDLEKYKSVVFSALRGEFDKNTWRVEYRFQDAAGIYRDVVDKAFIFNNSNRAVRVIGAIQDITEQKKLQKKLLEQEKKGKREVVKSIIEAQEKERRKLSVELHDNVNQMLASCKLMLEFARENKEAAQNLTEKCYQSIQQVINEIRTISHDLNPSVIEDVGLADAIEQMIEKINLSGKLKIHFQHKIPAANFFKEEDKITLYRIVQEQINNIIKHAQASNAVIALFVREKTVRLSIQDDGKGFDITKAKKGLGLKNIANRVEYHTGEYTITSEPGKGCKLDVRLTIS